MGRSARVCSEPGCPEIVIGATRCETHTVHTYDRTKSARAKGYDNRWDKLSRDFRKTHPTCAVVGCGMPSQHVDHIDNLGPRGPRGYDPANLQALCHSHHSRKTNAYERAKRYR